jgi:hypothetical protein
MWLDSIEKDLKTLVLEIGEVTGSGPMATSRKRHQGSSRTVVPIEEEKEVSFRLFVFDERVARK